MANALRRRTSLIRRAGRETGPSPYGPFSMMFEEMLFDIQALDRVIKLLNRKTRVPRGVDATLDEIRDLLHDEGYTA